MVLDSLPQDQIYFILSQFGAFVFAFLYRQIDDIRVDRQRNSKNQAIRQVDSPQSSSVRNAEDEFESYHSSRTNRLLALAIPGLVISYLCYGSQILHIFILSLLSYQLLLHDSTRWVHLTTLILAMSHLSYLHFDRLFNDHSLYTVDITAPIMVLVQKVTTVAFALHDGKHRMMMELNRKQTTSNTDESNNKKLPPLTVEQQANALYAPPSPLEYFAYVFNFQTVICGPLVSYADFIDFVDGAKLRRDGLHAYPLSRYAVMRKLLITVTCGILIMTFVPLYPASALVDNSFVNASFFSKLLLLYLVAAAARLKYYFAWTLSESIANVSGLGFAGLDPVTREPKWNLLNNVDIFAFENAYSQRDAIQAWNKTTESWLRQTAYERAPKRYRLLLTYILSAMWHGFHPGYYITFLTGALFTVAARTSRRCLRYRFVAAADSQDSTTTTTISKTSPFFTSLQVYHVFTWIVTRAAMAYLVFPFILLEFHASMRIYAQMYYCGHLCAAAIVYFLPMLLKPESRSRISSNSPKTTTTTTTT